MRLCFPAAALCSRCGTVMPLTSLSDSLFLQEDVMEHTEHFALKSVTTRNCYLMDLFSNTNIRVPS